MAALLDEIRKNKDWSEFQVIDSFNPENLVSGYISRHQGDDYGALYIERVNNSKCPQLIYCTPKMHYPFSTNGNWHFPKAKTIHRHTKLDGTNLYALSYHDHKGKEFISYKTRIVPFLRNSKFGPFFDMWREILENQLPVEFLVRKLISLGYNSSWELWGARNPHLVKYDYPLFASLLFVRKGQKIFPPTAIPNITIPIDTMASFCGIVDKDYIWTYQETQKEIEALLKETEDGYAGQEGEVWYICDTNNDWLPVKLKPETIENIHWSQGGIGKNTIIATCQNAFENWDDPTTDNIKQLLLEEFSAAEIEKIHYGISKHLAAVKIQYEFKLRVMEEYNALGLNILENKQEVMRALSQKFRRNEMEKVFGTIWANTVK